MDVVKFIEERKRMCTAYKNCMDCPASDHTDCVVTVNSNLGADEQLKIVEEWSAAHPRKTRKDVFLKQWPNATTDTDGVLFISPCNVDARIKSNGYCETKDNCYACRREFWGEVVS